MGGNTRYLISDFGQIKFRTSWTSFSELISTKWNINFRKNHILEPYLGPLLTPFLYFDYNTIVFRNIRKNPSGIDEP